jgi:hypothetical protein
VRHGENEVRLQAVHRIDIMELEKLFPAQRTTQNMRQSSNPWNVAKKQAMTDSRKNSFGWRVFEEWNKLSD